MSERAKRGEGEAGGRRGLGLGLGGQTRDWQGYLPPSPVPKPEVQGDVHHRLDWLTFNGGWLPLIRFNHVIPPSGRPPPRHISSTRSRCLPPRQTSRLPNSLVSVALLEARALPLITLDTILRRETPLFDFARDLGLFATHPLASPSSPSCSPCLSLSLSLVRSPPLSPVSGQSQARSLTRRKDQVDFERLQLEFNLTSRTLSSRPFLL